MSYLKKLSLAIDDAERSGRLVDLQDVTGLSGDKLVGMLQRFALIMSGDKDKCYLEVGVFQGLTLTSVAATVPELKCYGIDNFSQFDINGQNQIIVGSRLKTHASDNAFLINADFEDALLSLENYIGNQKISVYFVDGPHDYRSQYLCLDFARKYLSSESVIIVDDSNYEHVRRANNDWLKANPNYALLFEAYTACHPKNMTSEMEKDSRRGWWNGVNVIVHDPEHSLVRNYPSVDESRERYFNDHLIHATPFAESAPELLNAFASKLYLVVPRVLKVLYRRKKTDQFFSMNTRSDKLMAIKKANFIDDN